MNTHAAHAAEAMEAREGNPDPAPPWAAAMVDGVIAAAKGVERAEIVAALQAARDLDPLGCLRRTCLNRAIRRCIRIVEARR